MIYIWQDLEDVKNKDIGVYDREVSPDRFLLLKGRKLAEAEFQPKPTVEFEITMKRVQQFDCLANNTLIPLVSQRLRMLLENIAPGDVQFFPAKLACKDGVLENYYFLNITHFVKGLDHEKSDYTTMLDLPNIRGFRYAVYKPHCLGAHYLARDEEYEGHLLVNDAIKRLFEKHKITGAWIVRPEEYYSRLYG